MGMLNRGGDLLRIINSPVETSMFMFKEHDSSYLKVSAPAPGAPLPPLSCLTLMSAGLFFTLSFPLLFSPRQHFPLS